ncbi:MAG: type III secretion system chaperone [Sulfitobacter sp.]|nr:type III secretion system chaperone [Sulfitobacter sp.]
MASELESLLSVFTQQRGMVNPQCDGKGKYFFLFDGDLELCLFQTGDSIYLEGEIGPLPPDPVRTEAFLKERLRRNLARLGDRREVLSIDPDSGHLVLYRQLPARNLSSQDFDRAVEDFVNALSFWDSETEAVPRVVAAPPPMRMLFP